MALKGTLKDFGIADILQLIGQQGKTGTLHLKAKDQEVDISFSEGAIVRAEPKSFHDGKWPIVRPVVIVMPDKPTGNVRKFLEYLVSEKGAAAMAESDFIPRAEAEAELAPK